MIDTHCHLTYEALHERVEQVVADAREAGVRRMITIGTSPDDARRAVALTDRFEGVYATAGLHPHYAADGHGRDAVQDAMRELASAGRIVALGEMGLDLHYPDPPIELQRQVFDWQLEVATEFPALPIVIHNREATVQTLATIEASGLPGGRFVFHCFTGGPGEVEKVLAIGACVGFTGIVTFANAREVAEASDRVPIDRLLIETDSPYLTPAPHRKVRPNEPKYVVHVARFLAERRGLEYEAFENAVDAKAHRVFGLAAS